MYSDRQQYRVAKQNGRFLQVVQLDRTLTRTLTALYLTDYPVINAIFTQRRSSHHWDIITTSQKLLITSAKEAQKF